MKIITLNSSAIQTYMECPEKWNLSYLQSLKLVSEKKSVYLDMGTAFHKILELFYIARLTMPLWDAAQEAVEKYVLTKEYDIVDPERQKIIVKRFQDYVMRYSSRDFQPIKLASIPSTEIGFSQLFFENERVRYILEGKIDLISNMGDDLIIVDHKTQGRFAELYKFRPQFMTYALASGLRKLVVNYIGFQKEVTEGRTFRRSLWTFPEHIIERWRTKIMKMFIEIDDRQEYLAMHPEEPQIFEMRESSCGGPFGSFWCPYAQICETDLRNQEIIKNIKQFKYEVVPYESWTLGEISIEEV